MLIAPTTGKLWYSDVPRSARWPTIMGIAVLLTTLGVFGVWAGNALIAGAVVSHGVFVATGQNKIIQHLEGGVIKEIEVREGDLVEPGQTLLLLDETTPNAELRRLALRHARSRAMEARLAAEARGQEHFSFPPDLSAEGKKDAEIAKILETQKLTFEARKNNLKSQIATLQESINGLEERIEGTSTQLSGVRQQIKFIGEELSDKNKLLQSGLIRKPEVLALQRMDANLQGEVGRLVGEMGDAKDRISRTKEQITAARTDAVKTAVEQLHEARAEQNDVRERMRAAEGILERIKITAPVKGIVVKLRYNTPGGVVEAGKAIMEIVPLNEPLVIEARVRPQDIEHVKIGLPAMVRLTALSRRLTPMISGEVIYVSADALPDDKRAQATGMVDAYVVRAKLDPLEIAQIDGFHPTPGMPAELYIKTRERTFLGYLMQPVRDSMSRAFREW